MGCVLGTSAAGEGNRQRSHRPPDTRRTIEQIPTDAVTHGVRVSKDGDGEGDKIRQTGDFTTTDRRKPVPQYSLKTAQGWPAWLCDVAGDAIKDWTPRRANTFEKLDKVLSLSPNLSIFIHKINIQTKL